MRSPRLRLAETRGIFRVRKCEKRNLKLTGRWRHRARRGRLLVKEPDFRFCNIRRKKRCLLLERETNGIGSLCLSHEGTARKQTPATPPRYKRFSRLNTKKKKRNTYNLHFKIKLCHVTDTRNG